MLPVVMTSEELDVLPEQSIVLMPSGRWSFRTSQHYCWSRWQERSMTSAELAAEADGRAMLVLWNPELPDVLADEWLIAMSHVAAHKLEQGYEVVHDLVPVAGAQLIVEAFLAQDEHDPELLALAELDFVHCWAKKQKVPEVAS